MKTIILGVMFLLCSLRYGLAIPPEDTVSRDMSRATLTPPGTDQIDKCTLTIGTGQINLWPVGSKDPPRFLYHSTPNPAYDFHLYSYDPCYPFTQGDCANSHVCRSDGNKQNDISIGLQDGVFLWDAERITYMIQYIGIHQGVGEDPVITNVYLTCIPADLQDSLVVLGNVSKGLYEMELNSHCCCLNGCSTLASNKLSFGSILCIIFVCMMFVYFVGGMIYMKAVRGAQGTEIIPNVSFWMDLPNLIMDGVTFVFSCGKADISPSADSAPGSRKTEYDSI